MGFDRVVEGSMEFQRGCRGFYRVSKGSRGFFTVASKSFKVLSVRIENSKVGEDSGVAGLVSDISCFQIFYYDHTGPYPQTN